MTQFSSGNCQRRNLSVQQDIESHLIAYYKLNGDAQDSFGSNHGTVENASSTTGVDQADNSAYYFNGSTTDVIRLPNTLLHQRDTYSICAWVFYTNKGLNTYFVSGSDDGGNRLLLGIKNTYINDQILAATPLWHDKMTSQKWHHLCFVYDSPNLKTSYYLDGTLSGRLDLPAAYTMNVLPGGITVGQDQDTLGGGFASGDAFKGKLQHLRFYDRQIFPNQVYNMFVQDRGDCTFACTSCNNTGQCTICRGNRILRSGKCLCPQGTFEDFSSTNCSDMQSEADDGLVAYYPMHYNSTDVVGNNDGTIIDLEPGVDRFGNPAKALDFPRVITQQFRIPHTLIHGRVTFSVSCWMYWRGNSSIMLSGTTSGGNNLILSYGGSWIHDSSVNWYYPNLGERLQNKWAHILYVIDTSEVRAYIDGDLVDIRTKGSAAWNIGTNGLLIGQDQDTLGGGFQIGSTTNAIISDYKIYHKVVTSDQAKKVYKTTGEYCSFGCETCLTGQTICGSCKGDRQLVQGECICPQGKVDDQKSYNCVDIDTFQQQGLQAYYPLHNNVNDIINGYDGTAYAVTPVANRFGESNKAYKFVVGTSTYLSIPPDSYNGRSTVTFAMWLTQTQIDNDQRFIISSATTGNFNYLLIGLDHGSGIDVYQLQKAMEKDVWYHIIFSIDTNKFTVYLNGEQYYTQSRTQGVLNAGNCIIGQEQDSYNGGFVAAQALVGHLSDFRIYDYALGDSEAQMLYYSEAYPCPHECQTCLQKNTVCATCKGNRYQSGTDCLCPASFYEDYASENCPSCEHQCATCQGTANGCLTCSDTNRSLGNTIKCDCDDGWFDQGSNNPVCGKCDNKCATCHISKSTCKTCQGLNRNNDPPSCTCPYGYWDDGTDCQQCASQCNGCSGSTTNCNACTDPEKTMASQCTQCKGDKTLDGSNNCVCAKNGEFELAGNDNCQQCDYKCATCVVSATTCQTCSDTNRSTSNATTCACNDGWFENGSNNTVCGKCVAKCAKCVTNSTNCTQCAGTNRNNDFPNCTCVHGYYDDNTNANCQCNIKCDSQCNGCTGAADSCDACVDPEKSVSSKCLSCKGDKTLDGSNNCVCAVAGEYELSGNDNCQQCEYQCATCVTSSDNCQTCSDSNRGVGNTPKCGCNSGWYDQGSNNKVCGKCSPFCSKCVTSASNCTQCQGLKRNQDPPSCTCQHGYYHDPTQADCKICDSQCDGCTGAADNCDACSDLEKTLASKCLLCKGDKTLDGSNNCICNVQGKYELAGNDNCQDCEYQCESCVTSSDNCQTCSDSNRSPTNSPKCTCNVGWFDQGSSNPVCGKCSYQCLDCSGTADNCGNCQGNNRNNNAPTCDCAIGYFQDGTNQDCSQCVSKCKKCVSSSDNCTECSHVNRDINRNCECGLGFYGDCSTSCQNNCLECTGTADNCTECNGQNRYSDNTPTCDCLPGYYDDGVQADCLICQVSNCLECNPLQPTECTLAQDGYFLTGATPDNTEKCPFECLTCDKDGCIECALSNLPERILESSCQCPQKYFSDGVNTQCQECLPECKTCKAATECQLMEYCEIQCLVCQKSSDNCLLCKGKNREPIPSCLCKQKYYQDENSSDCLSCPSQCLECTNYDNCTKCISDLFTGQKCDQQIMQNSFQLSFENQSGSNEIIYSQCQIQCSTCQYEQDNCTECAVGIERSMLKPKCGCNEGYHDNNGLQLDCIKCPPTCKTCLDSKQCSSCTQGLNRILNHYNNQCECAQGYTTKGNSLECFSCYAYKDDCFLKCPKQTQADEINKVCIEISTSYEENFLILYMGLGFIVFVQLTVFCLVKICTSSLFKSKNYSKKPVPSSDEEANNSQLDNNSNNQTPSNDN